MVYSELLFNLSSSEEFHKDLLIDALSGIGFDTFEDVDQGFKAYIPTENLDEVKVKELKDVFSSMFSFYLFYSSRCILNSICSDLPTNN